MGNRQPEWIAASLGHSKCQPGMKNSRHRANLENEGCCPRTGALPRAVSALAPYSFRYCSNLSSGGPSASSSLPVLLFVNCRVVRVEQQSGVNLLRDDAEVHRLTSGPETAKLDQHFPGRRQARRKLAKWLDGLFGTGGNLDARSSPSLPG